MWCGAVDNAIHSCPRRAIFTICLMSFVNANAVAAAVFVLCFARAQGQPQGSLFTKSTPLMWDLRKAKEAENSACTKSRLFQQSAAMEGGSYDPKESSQQFPYAHLPNDIGSPHYNQHAQESSQYSAYENSYGSMDKSSSLQSQGRDVGSFGLSALQQTLVDCGKLQRADGQQADQMSQQVYKSLKSDINQTKKHALWLKHKQQPNRHRQSYEDSSYVSGLEDCAGSFFSKEEAELQDAMYDLDGPKSRSKSKLHTNQTARLREKTAVKTLRQRASTHSNSTGDLSKYKKQIPTRTRGFRGNSSVMKIKGSGLEESRVLESGSGHAGEQRQTLPRSTELRNNSLCSSVRGDKKLQRYGKPPKVTDYSEDMAAHLDVTLVANSSNPHRAQFRGDSEVKFGSHQSLKVLQNKGIDPKIYTKSNMNTQYGTYNVTVKEPVIRDLPSKEYISKAMTQISKQMLISYSTRVVETGAALRALQSSKHEKPGIAAILELNRALIAAASFNPSPWEVSRLQLEHVMTEQVPWFEKAAVARLASAYDPQKSGVIKYARMTAALMAGNRPAMSILMTNISRDPDKVDESGNVFLLRLLHSLYEDCDGGVVEEIASTMESDPRKCMKMAKPNSKTGKYNYYRVQQHHMYAT
jgi:hypothetical protein